MNKIIAGYISQVGCAKSAKNIRIKVVCQKELFLQGHAHPSLVFRQHERLERHIHLEKK